MKKFLIVCLMLLTSICEASSQDGSVIYVDKDGWVIGANQNQSKEIKYFNLKRDSTNSFNTSYCYPSNDQTNILKVKNNSWFK